MKSFSARILKIGINPYVGVPEGVLGALFRQADKTKGPIQVRGTINGKRFQQTLVKYQGAWRLYINGEMRQAAEIDVGDEAHIKIEYDPLPRIELIPPKFGLLCQKVRLQNWLLKALGLRVRRKFCAI